jgi:hypothetical protein
VDENGERVVGNRGSVCARPAGAPAEPLACPLFEFEADDTLALEVDFGICLSSSCDHDERANCKATVEGSLITVTSEGSYVHDGDECTDDCGFLVAECEVGPLPAGDYEVAYAGETLALTLPSSQARVCTGRDGFGCCDGDADCAEGTCGTENLCVVP